MYLPEYKIAKKIASDVGKMLQENFLSNTSILISKGKDIKTDADFAANELILEALSVTDIPIISEEKNNSIFNLNDFQWIIDPLDGTLNLSRGFGMSAVSISLWDKGMPIFGVVYCIFSNQVFSTCMCDISV